MKNEICDHGIMAERNAIIELWEETNENQINIEDTKHVIMRLRQPSEDIDMVLHTP